MPIVTAATAALVGIGLSAATAAAVAPVAVSLAGGIGLSLVANALAPPEPVTQAGVAATGLEKELADSTVYPRTWLVGRVATAGSHIYSQVSDVKPSGEKHGGPEQNRYFDTVIALADHECEGLHRLQVNDNWRTGLDTDTPGKMGAVVPGFDRNGEETLYVKFHEGTEGQDADERLVEASRKRDDNSDVWTNAHKLSGVCYARLTAKYDEKKHKTWPEAVFVVDGAKFWDIRKDSTVSGGSGSHRYDSPNTWEWTRNPAVMLAHFVRGWQFPAGKHYVGLQGTTLAMLDIASFQQAANDCDDEIDLKGGGTEPRYRCDFEFSLDMDNAAMAETLLSSMAGRLCWTGARWRLFAGKAQTAVASITDADILISEPREFDPKTGLADLVNRVVAEYTDPDEDWSVVAAQPRASSADQAEDGRQLTLELSLHAVQSNTQAQRIMEIARRQAREQKRHRIGLPPKFLDLEVGDWIEWTSDRWGYVAKPFRIDNIEIAHDLTIFVHLAETNANIFAWDEDVDELGKNARDLAPGGDPDDDVNLALTLSTFVDRPYTKKAAVGIAASWVDPENRRIASVQLQWRRQGGSRIFTEHVDVDDLGWATTKAIREETTYQVRGRPQFRDGSYGAWTADDWGDADTIVSAALFDRDDAPVPALTVTSVVKPDSGDKRRAALQVSWSEASMRWPAGASPPSDVDERIVGLEFRYRVLGEGNTDWQHEQTRGLDDRAFRVFKGIRPGSTYEYEGRFLFRGGETGRWSDSGSSPIATHTVAQVFDAATFPVPDLVGTASAIEAISIAGPDGSERAGFKLTIPDGGDARITACEIQWKKSGDADAERHEKIVRDYSTVRIVEGIHSRQAYQIRARFLAGEDSGNWSNWVTPISAVDAREDDTLITREGRVKNGSFERLDAAGFAKFWEIAAGSASIGTDAAKAKHRSRYLSITSLNSVNVRQIADGRMDAEEGEEWVASVWVSRSGTVNFGSGNGAFIAVQFFDRDGGLLAQKTALLETISTSPEYLIVRSDAAPGGTASVGVALGQTNRVAGSTGELIMDFVKGNVQLVTKDIADGAVGSQKIADGAVGSQKIAAGAVGVTHITADAVTLAGSARNDSGGVIGDTSFTEILIVNPLPAKKQTMIDAVLNFRSNNNNQYSECYFMLTINQPGFSQQVVATSGAVGSRNDLTLSPPEIDNKVVTLSGVYELLGGSTSANLVARVYAMKKDALVSNGRWEYGSISWLTRAT